MGVYRWHYAPKDVTFLRFCFSGEIEGEEKDRKLDHGIAGVRWLSPKALAARQADHRSPLVKKCVDDYLRGQRFPLGILSKEFA